MATRGGRGEHRGLESSITPPRAGACHRAGHFGPDPLGRDPPPPGEGETTSFSRRIVCVRVLLATTPRQRFASDQTGKRGAERRIVQPMSARRQVYAVCVTHLPSAAACRAARRLSALTLAALATGYYPDGSAPEPGFPRRAAKRAFLPLRQQTVLRLSTLRADRSLCRSTGDPGPPGCGLAIPRAGTAPRLRCFGMPSGTAPCIVSRKK
jgi:hypothetical protein